MDIIKTTNPDEFYQYAEECLSGHEGMVIHICESPCVWTGQLQTMDTEASEKKGLYVGTGRYMGGSIVNMIGDISIALTTWGDSDFAPKAVASFGKWLESKKLNVSYDENDVLIDKKKVLSWARATTKEGWCQSVIHFSVGKMNLDLVRKICTKPMEKIPGSLEDYGITTEHILSWLELTTDRLNEEQL